MISSPRKLSLSIKEALRKRIQAVKRQTWKVNGGCNGTIFPSICDTKIKTPAKGFRSHNEGGGIV